jgi:hypothetical protein
MGVAYKLERGKEERREKDSRETRMEKIRGKGEGTRERREWRR